jgi:hypothetical protein
MLHYFNPGHEAAVLNGSKYYQAPFNHVKMQRELAFLPLWYAQPDDFVLVFEPVPESFLREIASLRDGRLARAVSFDELERLTEFKATDELYQQLVNQTVDVWGISPQACHFLTQLSAKHRLNWTIPEWKDEYRTLGSRQTAHTVLSTLIETVPDIDKNILPQFYTNLDEIEQVLVQNAHKINAEAPIDRDQDNTNNTNDQNDTNYTNNTNKRENTMLAKAPFSSSGKGLVWLPPGEMAQSERQILKGLLCKQATVSLERALDKQLDFSMHFEIAPVTQGRRSSATNFIGYSLFQTNAKGAYEKSLLLSQEAIEKQLIKFISGDLLKQIRGQLLPIIDQIYAPHYRGAIGVDMLIYLDGNQTKLHPCVEINMRKSMGYLALKLFERFCPPNFTGEFRVGYKTEDSRFFSNVNKC